MVKVNIKVSTLIASPIHHTSIESLHHTIIVRGPSIVRYVKLPTCGCVGCFSNYSGVYMFFCAIYFPPKPMLVEASRAYFFLVVILPWLSVGLLLLSTWLFCSSFLLFRPFFSECLRYVSIFHLGFIYHVDNHHSLIPVVINSCSVNARQRIQSSIELIRSGQAKLRLWNTYVTLHGQAAGVLHHLCNLLLRPLSSETWKYLRGSAVRPNFLYTYTHWKTMVPKWSSHSTIQQHPASLVPVESQDRGVWDEYEYGSLESGFVEQVRPCEAYLKVYIFFCACIAMLDYPALF